MGEYLVFTLTAALGSMGEFAGHDRRGSLAWPGRSAILGLLGAAKGIRREDDVGFNSLDSLRMAVALFCPGEFLRDYHTIQSVPKEQSEHAQSRPQALRDGGKEVVTSITQRDYRTGPLYGVAVWGDDNLSVLQEALRHPFFTLYLGRKSCPLAAPVAARVVSAPDAVAALSHVTIPPWRSVAGQCEVMADDGMIEVPHRKEIRKDKPIRDGARWHFGPRTVAVTWTDIAPRVAGQASA